MIQKPVNEISDYPMKTSVSNIQILVRGTGISFVGKIIGRGLILLGQIVLARMLGPENFGLYAIGWTMLSMGSFIAPLGLEKGVIHYALINRKANIEKSKAALFQSLFIATISGATIAVGIFLFSKKISSSLFDNPDLTEVIRWFSPALALLTVSKVAAAITRIKKRMKYSLIIEELLPPLTLLILILLFYQMDLGFTGTLVAVLFSFTITFLFSIVVVNKLFPGIFSQVLNQQWVIRDLISFSVPASLASVFTMFIVWVNRLLVGYFRTEGEVGIYHVASQSSIFFPILLSAIGYIFTPIIIDLHRERAFGQLDKLFKVSTRWGLYLSIPIFFVLIFAPKELLIVVFGFEYSSGAIPLIILAIGQMFNISGGTNGIILTMTGYPKVWLWISGSMFLVSIVLTSSLIPSLGLIGAALGTSIAILGQNILGLFFVRRLLGIWPYDRALLKGIIAGIMTGVALLSIQQLRIQSTLLWLGVTIVTSIVVFMISLFVMGFEKEDQEIIQSIKAYFKQSEIGRIYEE